MQVRYVNKALQRFDSTQVIPIQFVLFTLCVITGSAVLYRDFERTTAEEAMKFVGGCLLTFFGVFLITSGRHQEDDEETLSEVDGVEETIGLAEQGQLGQRRSPHSSVSSRRSSRVKRVSYIDAIIKPLTLPHETGVPSGRTPTATAKSPLESTPLLGTPLDAADDLTRPAGMRSNSADSVTVVSTSPPASERGTPSTPQTNSAHPPEYFGADRPITPRASTSTSRPHSHLFPDLMISPSPLASTVSAVVKDTLRRTADGPILHKSSLRKIRSSIRASLFMPDDESGGEEGVGPSRLREVTANEPSPATDATDATDDNVSSGSKGGVRKRARSLSNTLGEFFGVKRKEKGESVTVSAPVTDIEDASDVDDHGEGPA